MQYFLPVILTGDKKKEYGGFPEIKGISGREL
jgi:hypothetical protein